MANRGRIPTFLTPEQINVVLISTGVYFGFHTRGFRTTVKNLHASTNIEYSFDSTAALQVWQDISVAKDLLIETIIYGIALRTKAGITANAQITVEHGLTF